MTDIWLFIGIALTLLASASFSAIETVFLTLDRLKLYSREALGDTKTKKIRYFIDNPERFFISTLVGNNLVNVAYSSMIALLFHRFGVKDEVLFLLSPLIVLVVGEATPKAIARQFADRLSHAAASTLYAAWIAIWPLNRLVELSVQYLERLFGIEEEQANISLTRSDFTFAIHDAASTGMVDEMEFRSVRRLINFSERTVADVITPRTHTAMIKIDATTEEAFKLLAQTGHKRLVCYGTNQDDLLGVINASDMLNNPPDLQSILRPVPIVPESLSLVKLSEWLRRQRTHFALAIDEYGGFSGIVTLNDLAAELVGPIRDRFADDSKDFVRLSERTWLVNGNVRLSHLRDLTGFDPGATHSNSLGGLLVEQSGNIPHNGFECKISGVKLRVIRSDTHGVHLVRLALGNERNLQRKT